MNKPRTETEINRDGLHSFVIKLPHYEQCVSVGRNGYFTPRKIKLLKKRVTIYVPDRTEVDTVSVLVYSKQEPFKGAPLQLTLTPEDAILFGNTVADLGRLLLAEREHPEEAPS